MFNNRKPLSGGINKSTGPLTSGINRSPLNTKPLSLDVLKNESEKEGLENLQFVLQYMDYETAHLPVDSENTVEQLFVSLAAEDEEFTDNSPFVQIMFINDLVAPVMETNTEITNVTYILQFFVSLPINVPSEKRPLIHELLSVISNIIPIGHLAFNPESSIFYRYNLVIHKREVEPEVALEIIEMIRFFVLIFAGWIEQFCQGIINMEQAVESIEKELGKPRV